MKKFSLIIFMLSNSLSAFSGGFSNVGVITEVYVNSGFTQVQMSGGQVNPDSCSATASYGFKTTDQNYEGLLSAILSAQMAGKNVQFYLTGCSGQNDAYPKIVSIKIAS